MKNGRMTSEKVLLSLLCLIAVIFAGCGAKEAEEEGMLPPQTGQSIEGDAAAAEEEPETVFSESQDGEVSGVSVDQGQENIESEAEENSESKGEELWRAQIRHYYGGVLSQIIAAWQLPDGELDTSSLDAGFGQMRDNHFAVTDIDGDGREELIVSYVNANMAGMVEIIYDYDPVLGELKREFTWFPALTYYDNGIIKAEASHNHSQGEFWPFALYRYEPDSDSYVEIGYVTTWDKEFSSEWYEGQSFPDELDIDGDGTVFYIREGGDDSIDYENFKYDQADFDKWYDSLLGGANEVSINYQPMEYESFADFTPDYLKLLAEEAGKERTDTEVDLGLLVFGEEHFLDVSKKLLSEKYDVVLTQPDAAFEEYMVGTLEGRDIFSFEHLNAGVLDYHGEKVEDVTIFGLYPGISVDGAWEKLKAYGFYASPYGEVENCLITGEGFGNISVWFSEEEGKVTQIALHPYCAFAG